jgi:hypothetical protein
MININVIANSIDKIDNAIESFHHIPVADSTWKVLSPFFVAIICETI